MKLAPEAGQTPGAGERVQSLTGLVRPAVEATRPDHARVSRLWQALLRTRQHVREDLHCPATWRASEWKGDSREEEASYRQRQLHRWVAQPPSERNLCRQPTA